MPAIARLVFCLVGFTGLAFASDARPAPRIALLIGCPWNISGEETVIQNDVASLRSALEKRGFQPGEIKELSGKTDRGAVLGTVDSISRTVASWKEGEVFLYYTGHGSVSGTSASRARPALALASEALGDHIVYWDEVFSGLHLPPGVRLVLLPDC
jgi:hypothetical protein